MSVSEPSPSTASNPLRAIPSVDRLLRELGEVDLPRPMVLATIRRIAAAHRAHPVGDLLQQLRDAIQQLRRSRLQPVINGTGVILHTNFGRAPLGASNAQSMLAIATQYNNLEFDLSTGERGKRAGYVDDALAVLCNAERAAVVNNCAAALVLIVHHLAGKPPRNRVIVSRGELVQIGGGFRIPEILQASGAELAEVGTTNKTTLSDYRNAVDDRTAMILRVHRSNFYMGGFVDSPAPSDIANVAHAANLPFVEDIGSGATFDTSTIGQGQEREPTPAESIAGGADLVCFSGDKLLGGPQAGVIVGRSALVDSLRRDPFFRALRCDKLILAALQNTVDLLLACDLDQIPARKMMELSVETLRNRADRMAAAIGPEAEVGVGRSRVGGGTLPQSEIETVVLKMRPRVGTVDDLAARLRDSTPPIIGYITADRFCLDLRTIFPDQDDTVVTALAALASAAAGQ